ncbi:AI-2E family transporter [Paraliomyxa miuraensis]|uniref:AI-2E family transporter n=1 Tax=Paraliomyxa miuraensis TaxID=376150 RepID=UPI002258A049|nr:AI-2E family transporter [Paraliomyxa miuraensis]MCX4243777.1 AI-2E family transporter [Paraliomyxa miuraensis]
MARVTETTAVRTLLVLAALVIIVAGLKLAGTLLLPFLVAVFLSIVVAPFVLWLERRGFPPGWAVMVTMVGVIGVMLGFGALVTQSVAGFEQAVPGYRAALDATFAELLEWLAGHGIDVEEALRGESIEPGMVVGMAGSFVGNVIAALSNTALVVLTMVFILLEVAGFPTKLRAALGDPEADLSELSEIMAEVQRYLGLKTVISAATGVCVLVLLSALGVDFPLLWGMVAFLLNFIPNVGSIIAALPAMAVALVQPDQGPLSMVLVGLGYLAINTVIGNLIEPQLLGRRLGLSPLVVFVSLVFWGWVWGPVGMVLSVPMTIAVRIALERHEMLRWIAVLLGPSPDWERPPGALPSWWMLWRRARVSQEVTADDEPATGAASSEPEPSPARIEEEGARPEPSSERIGDDEVRPELRDGDR